MAVESRDPQQSRELLDSGEDWLYVDVRTVEEFNLGHPPGAYNVPVFLRDPITMQMTPNPEFLVVMLANFQPGQQLVLGCAAGGRSMHACLALEEAGFGTLVNMDGGFLGRRDPNGMIVQPGWHPLGYPNDTEARSGRTYEELRANA